MKDTWKGFSKNQKVQLVAVFALVLGLPMILGGVYTAKYIGSRAYIPITSPVTPPTSSPTPVSQCSKTCSKNSDCPSGLICYIYQVNVPGSCRNARCPSDASCLCITPSPSTRPTPIVSPTPFPTKLPCVTKTQTVSLTPKSQSGHAGDSLIYNIAVTNNNIGCLKTDFALITQTPYTNWTVGLSNTLLSLGPGATGTAQVIFTSSKSTGPGSYPVGVGARSSISTVYATSAYAVLTPTPTPKPTPTPITKSCGVICQTSAQCPGGLTCYQPPTPPCPAGKACSQVMPAKVCRNPSCVSNANCVCATPSPTPRFIPAPTPIAQPACRLQFLGFCLIK